MGIGSLIEGLEGISMRAPLYQMNLMLKWEFTGGTLAQCDHDGIQLRNR